MTVSCRYADYVLPGTSAAEESDYHDGENGTPMAYGIVSSQSIKPLYQCKDVYTICTELAYRLGIKDDFTEDRTHVEVRPVVLRLPLGGQGSGL